MREYRPQVYPGRLTLFLADEQPMGYYDPQLGWGGLAAGGLEIQTVPGDHESIVKEPHVQVLATKLRACLCRASFYEGFDESPAYVASACSTASRLAGDSHVDRHLSEPS
jgi:hypothetical protein